MNVKISASVGRSGVNRADDVRAIQRLLNDVSVANGGPTPSLVVDGICGPRTTDAIQKFQLKHFGWKGADGRVDPDGPTLRKLNELSESKGNENQTQVCCLHHPCPPDCWSSPASNDTSAGFQPVKFPGMGFVPTAATPQNDDEIMNQALRDSRATLTLGRNALSNLLQGFRNESTTPLNDFQKRVLISCRRWLKIDTNQNNAARGSSTAVIQKAITLMDRNLAVKTTSGASPTLRRKAGLGAHAQTTGDPNKGVDCGDPFFNIDGPRCRRDVITHEFFHFLGVNHGGGAANAPTPRSSIVTSAQALDSADNLAQLISELMDGTRDACATAGR